MRGWEHGYLHACMDAQQRTFLGHSSAVWSVSFSSDGKQIISVGANTSVRAWDVQTGNEVFAAIGSGGWTTCAGFSPDGKRFVCSSFNVLKICDVHTGQEILTLKGHTGSIE